MTELRRRLSELMGGDHQDLDERWERLRSTPETDLEARRRLFEAFREDLLDHIALEESELFPRMQEADPGQRALVERLLTEHREIRGALDRISDRLAHGSGSIEDLGQELIDVLWEHNAREEAAAYPWLDEHVTTEETRAVGDRLQRHGHR